MNLKKMYWNIVENKNQKLSYWQILDYYKIKHDLRSYVHDNWVNWHNLNRESAIIKMLRRSKIQLLCQLELFMDYNFQHPNYSQPVATIQEFEKFLESNITLYRGGKWEYDPKTYYQNKRFVSFTISEDRVNTFSKYSGSFAMQTYKLPENNRYWQVKLIIKPKDILLYFDVQDQEAIVSVEDALKATLIKQT